MEQAVTYGKAKQTFIGRSLKKSRTSTELQFKELKKMITISAPINKEPLMSNK